MHGGGEVRSASTFRSAARTRWVLLTATLLLVLAWGIQAIASCPAPPGSIWLPLADAEGEWLPMEYNLLERGGLRILEARGMIRNGETGRLRAAISRNSPFDELWLYSGGGSSQEGVEMGRLIRKRGLAVRIPRGAACFSACSMVFLGGALRAVDPGGYYGVHMWTRWGDIKRASSVVEFIRSLTEKNVPEDLIVAEVSKLFQSIERRNAEYARQRANYLIEMSVSLRLMIPNVRTEAKDQYWLCPNEMRKYNVSNY